MKARAVVFAAPRRIEIEEIDVPEPGEGDVVARTLRSGISGGTELLAYRGEIDPDLPVDERLGALAGTFRFPFRYGYSCVGRVERGSGGLREGDLVFAYHPHADVTVVPRRDAVALGEIEARVATLFPIVETALQISLDAGDLAGEKVVVLGLGPIGIVTAMLLARGGAEVLAAEPRELRREVAARLGIAAYEPDALADAVDAVTGRAGVPLAIEASGTPGVLDDALRLLAHEGTALVASWYGSKPVPLSLGAEFHRRRLTIRSTQVSTIPERQRSEWSIDRRRSVALELLRELPIDALATHEVPFERAAAAYEMIDRGDESVMHVALRYG